MEPFPSPPPPNAQSLSPTQFRVQFQGVHGPARNPDHETLIKKWRHHLREVRGSRGTGFHSSSGVYPHLKLTNRWHDSEWLFFFSPFPKPFYIFVLIVLILDFFFKAVKHYQCSRSLLHSGPYYNVVCKC